MTSKITSVNIEIRWTSILRLLLAFAPTFLFFFFSFILVNGVKLINLQETNNDSYVEFHDHHAGTVTSTYRFVTG